MTDAIFLRDIHASQMERTYPNQTQSNYTMNHSIFYIIGVIVVVVAVLKFVGVW